MGNRLSAKSFDLFAQKASFVRGEQLARHTSETEQQNLLHENRRFLADLYSKFQSRLKGLPVAFAEHPEVKLGTVAEWNCKAVWIKIKLEVDYATSKAREVHTFFNPKSQIVIWTPSPENKKRAPK